MRTGQAAPRSTASASLSEPTSSYGRRTHPCKGCLSTAMPLCHWPLGLPAAPQGRADGVRVHGDVGGIEGTRRSLSDWLDWMGLIDTGPAARLDRSIGYYQACADSHGTLDADRALRREARNLGLAVAHAVRELRAGRLARSRADLPRPRPK